MAKLNIDTDYVAQLAELLQRTGPTEIEISVGDARGRVVKKPAPVIEAQVAARPAVAATAAAAGEAAPAVAVDVPHPGTVNSPMVGTVYLYPEPGADPFASPGQTVSSSIVHQYDLGTKLESKQLGFTVICVSTTAY